MSVFFQQHQKNIKIEQKVSLTVKQIFLKNVRSFGRILQPVRDGNYADTDVSIDTQSPWDETSLATLLQLRTTAINQ